MIADTLINLEKEKTKPNNNFRKPIYILWVDDEIEFLKLHIDYLRLNGFVITTSNNGLDAVYEVSEQHYDIILMDENMPGLSGIETILKIKEINTKIPVVMVTKNESLKTLKDATRNQVADYLAKPISLTQIYESVNKILDSIK